MATSSGSVFGATLQTITTTKLEELAKQRTVFEEEYTALVAAAKAETDPLKRLCLLLDGSKACLGFQTEKRTKNGRTGSVISGSSRNVRFETDLKNLDRFIEQARFDPSVASRAEWEKDVFNAAEVDEQALRSYLDELFKTDSKDGSAAILKLRQKVEDFELSFKSSTSFNNSTLRSTIKGLLNSNLLSNEKREALRDFLSNGKYAWSF